MSVRYGPQQQQQQKKKLEKELCCLIITEIDHISIKKLMCLISLLNYFVFSMHSLFLEHLFIAYDETLFIKMKLNIIIAMSIQLS